MTATVRVSLLGPLEVTVAGHPMTAIGGPGRRALLTALSLGLGTTLSVPELLEAIWDDRPPMTATTKLQGHICALRQTLAGFGAADALQTKPPGYVLCRHRVTTDLVRHDELIRRARDAGLPERAELLRTALSMWRGASACADLRSAWAAGVTHALDERRWRVMEDLAEADLALGDPAAAIDAMESLVRQAPYRERAWEHLMAAHLERGDIAAALAVHDRLSRTLASGLGVAPGHRIAHLIDTVRSRSATAHR
ncbi:hypothetical protein GCM10010112_23760 [Actinoplanes lobatus]|uniref:DNA-binding SARP family transcriptional activator n=1 Tax=Actinoplanes lobatus TaxID=113568 RepID=A0A7W7HJ01_9ACTN|nr:BTAD domain-containing putative transcriptional regulator [Actinoplanes lobatus]MBB4751418.1 DNA-binding SARP family transcriptional activator [Actinoplanes lobatus]GGN63996.1 hypothetical protein GCM10010112_23760 [Actinoplanes lobatus]GIE41027.1 hypothetical protein Alo02nite_39250 [Actinoplanes lobatus]